MVFSLLVQAKKKIEIIPGDDSIPTPTTAQIPAENECLLLCDMYPTLTLFVDWKDYTTPDDANPNKGERTWFYRWFNSPEGEKIELKIDENGMDMDNIIKCWP